MWGIIGFTVINICLTIVGWALYLRERKRVQTAQAAINKWQKVFTEWKHSSEVWQESARIWKDASTVWREAAESYQRSSENWRELYLQKEENNDDEELIN